MEECDEANQCGFYAATTCPRRFNGNVVRRAAWLRSVGADYRGRYLRASGTYRTAGMTGLIGELMLPQQAGSELPLTIANIETGKVLGTPHFMEIETEHRVVEVAARIRLDLRRADPGG